MLMALNKILQAHIMEALLKLIKQKVRLISVTQIKHRLNNSLH